MNNESNSKFFIVDCHAHTYPNREIGLASQGGESMCGNDGTIPELLDIMKKAGIFRAVMVNMTPVGAMREASLARLPPGLSNVDKEDRIREIDRKLAGRIERRNLWTTDVARDNPVLVPFIGLDPIMGADLIREEVLDKVQNHGAKGIKIVPSEQQFSPVDHWAWPIYEVAQEIDLPILADSGKFPNDPQFGEPRLYEQVKGKFPRLRLILAHLGRGFYDQTLQLAKAYPSVYFDCSDVVTRGKGEGLVDAPDALSDTEFISLIRDVGVERVMFGSDYPFLRPEWGIRRILNLDMSEQEKRAILGQNAVRILGLKENVY
jgi:predicted TIM-barrel fold metal-dependent hydrolase